MTRGIVRAMDELGRIVIPKEVRAMYEMEGKDYLEVCPVQDGVLLKKYSPGCVLCGGFEQVSVFNGKNICMVCKKEIAEEMKG